MDDVEKLKRLEDDYSVAISELGIYKARFLEYESAIRRWMKEVDDALKKIVKSDLIENEELVEKVRTSISNDSSISNDVQEDSTGLGPGPSSTTGPVELFSGKLSLLSWGAKELVAPRRAAGKLQKTLEALKQQSLEDQEHFCMQLSYKDDEIENLKKLMNELQKQRKAVIDSSTEGVRGARLENEQLKSDLQQAKEERDILDLWNAENLRILSAQDEKFAKMKSTENLLKEQDLRFKQESSRLVRSWNAQKLTHEQNLKNITKLEATCDDLKNQIREKDRRIRVLAKAQKSKELDAALSRCERLKALLVDAEEKEKIAEGKYKKLAAQHDMASLHKVGNLGMDIDTVATIIAVNNEGGSQSDQSPTGSQTVSRPKKTHVPKGVNPYYVDVLKGKLSEKDSEIAELNAKTRKFVKSERDWGLRLDIALDEKRVVEAKLETLTARRRCSGIDPAVSQAFAATATIAGVGCASSSIVGGASSAIAGGASSAIVGGASSAIVGGASAIVGGASAIVGGASASGGSSSGVGASFGGGGGSNAGPSSGGGRGGASGSGDLGGAAGLFPGSQLPHLPDYPTPADILAQFSDDENGTTNGSNRPPTRPPDHNAIPNKFVSRYENPLESKLDRHWTSVLQKGRPRSAFTGRTLEKIQPANVSSVGSLVAPPLVRPSTSTTSRNR